MTETGYWLLGIVLAMTGIGLGMFYQGKILLMKPDEKKKIGKQLLRSGYVWIGIAFFYLIIWIVFWLVIPSSTP